MPIVSQQAGSASGSSPTVFAVTVNLTSAQILSIHTTPVQLVAAPGAGKLLVPVEWLAQFHAVTTPYVNDDGLTMRYAGGDTADIAFAGCDLTAAASNVGFNFPSSAAQDHPQALWANKALVVLASTTDPTVGDGTVSFTTVYAVATLL